jgi:tRNA(His) 5'-end guanylyltransferase
MSDEFGDRMKEYEKMHSGRLMPLLPAFARLDGVAFHTFTKGLRRPYDEGLTKLMVATTQFLAQNTNARLAYTQSDEITLMWYSDNYKSQIYFDGKIAKLTSVLAARASAYFNHWLEDYLPGKVSGDHAMPVFDCRVWSVPNQIEASNVFLWREQDATRNSISMAAQSNYSHKELHGKNCSQMQEMLFQKGINWNDYPAFFKRGTYVQRHTVIRPFSADEIENLPEKHEARKNPELEITRSEFRTLDMPPFSKVVNKTSVLFNGGNPCVPLEDHLTRKEPQ